MACPPHGRGEDEGDDSTWNYTDGQGKQGLEEEAAGEPRTEVLVWDKKKGKMCPYIECK